MIERNIDDGILTLRLAHGKASALDIELLDALALEINQAAADDGVKALIITGTGSIFSAGVDLYRLTNGGREYAQRFVPALSRMVLDLFSIEKPVVVAVNGHAIAGGCVITLAADYRLMSAGNARIGLPERLVGVPFPPSVIEVVRFAVPPQHVQMLMYTGATVTPDDALRLGLIDEVTDSLLERAEAIARQLAASPRIFALTKRQLRDKSITRAKHYAHELDAEIRELWSTPETHDRIRAYIAKTIKK
jgi:enoyl-CoA hydratase